MKIYSSHSIKFQLQSVLESRFGLASFHILNCGHLMTFQEEKAAAEQKVRALRSQLSVTQRDHVEELSTLQQCLREFGSQICSLCGGSTTPEGKKNRTHHVQTRDASDEDVKEKLVEGAKSPGVSESCGNVSNNDSISDSESLVSVAVTIQKGPVVKDKTSVLDTDWSSGNDEAENYLGFDGDGGIEMRTLSMKGYQYLRNEEAEDDIDDDEFLCETCGKPATNGMRVCDWCFC